MQDYIEQIAGLPLDQQKEMLVLLDELDRAKQKSQARKQFLPFIKYMWPEFVEGQHHRVIAQLFDDIIAGKRKRVIINMAPRHTKSEFSSIHLPAYFLGRYPSKKIIQASNTAELAVGFGRKVRSLVARGEFQSLFPDVFLSSDSKAAGRWETNKRGEYFAIGVGGTVSGRGADLLIIDDPHSEQEAVLGESNPEVYDKVMDWYVSGPRQRLQPGGAIVIVMTRWHQRDLTGQLIKRSKADKGTDKWDVVQLPAINANNKPIWPEYWSLEELLKTKASIPISKWNAQYQQNPTAEEGALIKREHWRDWQDERPPKCDAIIQSWDTAFTKTSRADYSACTTWGVWYSEEQKKNNLILLDAIRGKWEFPELKIRAKQAYREHQPTIVLIEGRAAGQPLVYELRAMGLPVHDFTVGRGSKVEANDKITRVNSITDIFASKIVWAPKYKAFAQEVIEECAAFPAGEHDDFVDTVVMALTRFRSGGWIGTMNDEEDDAEFYRRPVEYY